MIPSPKSCAVALPIHRNCATSENGATQPATIYAQTKRKPESIRELRAQLVAQRERSKAATVRPEETPKVAQEITTVASCAVAFPIDRNCATDLVREFMEVDGFTAEEAQALAAVSVEHRPHSEWMALVSELDYLIDRYCDVYRLSDEARAGIYSVRKRQSLASIPIAVDWYRRELQRSPSVRTEKED